MPMKNFSILEAVEVALQMEEEGIRFYALAEERAGDPEMKKLFAFLRDKEHQHIETFRRLYGDLVAREGTPDGELLLLDTEVSSWFRAYVESTVFPTKGAAERAIGGLHGVVDLAVFLGLRARGAHEHGAEGARLVALNPSLGVNSALLVDRLAGLRHESYLTERADEASQRPGFAGVRWLDKAGRPWQEIKLAALAADMQVLAIAA